MDGVQAESSIDEHPSLFSTLEATTAGFHTGRSLILSDRHLDSPVVYHHENSHGKIFQECTDGNLHIAVILALESDDFKGDHAELTALNKYLFTTTRIAHETVATYLGIQALGTDQEMKAAIQMMPPAYLDYYDFFDSKLNQIPSSYVRYLVAWATGRLAFNSGRAQAIDPSRLLSSVQSILGPTERLDIIGSYLAGLTVLDLVTFVHDCAHRVFATAMVAPFDIMQDDEWDAGLVKDQPGLQRFDSMMLAALGLGLSTQIPLPQRNDPDLSGYFSPIRNRFLLLRDPPDLKSDGTTDSYDLALSLARHGDETRIDRSNPLPANPYDADDISQWIDENAHGTICISAVETAENRGVYKLFLSNGNGLGSSYASGIPCLVTGSELSSIMGHVQEACRKHGTMIPPVFLFAQNGPRGDDKLAAQVSVKSSELVYWRPGIDVLPRRNLRIMPFLVAKEEWSGLITALRGTWSQVDPTFGIPEEGEEFRLALAFLFPREKDWIPYIRLMTTSVAAAYFPLLQWPSIKSRLKQREFPASAEPVAHASLSVWETLNRL